MLSDVGTSADLVTQYPPDGYRLLSPRDQNYPTRWSASVWVVAAGWPTVALHCINWALPQFPGLVAVNRRKFPLMVPTNPQFAIPGQQFSVTNPLRLPLAVLSDHIYRVVVEKSPSSLGRQTGLRILEPGCQHEEQDYRRATPTRFEHHPCFERTARGRLRCKPAGTEVRFSFESGIESSIESGYTQIPRAESI